MRGQAFFCVEANLMAIPCWLAWTEIAQALLDLKRRHTMTAIKLRPSKIMWELCGSSVKLVVAAKALRLDIVNVVAAVKDFSVMVYYSVASSKITTGKY
jgi:hypothetical protein